MLLLAWVGIAAAVTIVAALDLQDARADLRGLRQSLDVEALLSGSRDQELAAAEARFGEAADRLGGPFTFPARYAPVAGRQVKAAASLSRSAEITLDTSTSALLEARAILQQGAMQGEGRMRAFDRLARIAARSRERLVGLDLGPPQDLMDPLARARRDLERELASLVGSLEDIERGARGLERFVRGPSRYLVFAANNSQMQHGSGMFLSWGTLEAVDGHLDISDMTTVGNLQRPAAPVPLEPEFVDLYSFLDPNADWRHLGASPRFTVTASQAAALWESAGYGPVDGVISLDPLLLQALLDESSSFSVEGGTIQAEGVAQYLLNGQYQSLPREGRADQDNVERRADLTTIARAAVEALDGRRRIDAAFLERLASSVRERHLLLWARDEEVQDAFVATGAAGVLEPSSLSVAVVNRTGVKLDWFVNVRSTIEHVEAERYRLTVEVRNRAPLDQPRYVVGPFPATGLDRGDYLGLVAVVLPEGASVAGVSPPDAAVSSGVDGGHEAVIARVLAPAGQAASVSIEFTSPRRIIRTEASARAHPIRWVVGPARWDDGRPRRVELPR